MAQVIVWLCLYGLKLLCGCVYMGSSYCVFVFTWAQVFVLHGHTGYIIVRKFCSDGSFCTRLSYISCFYSLLENVKFVIGFL